MHLPCRVVFPERSQRDLNVPHPGTAFLCVMPFHQPH
jgi:hypothetical protein